MKYKPRILIIDDDAATRAFLREALSFEGYEIMVASDGRSGLQLLPSFSPDLILLDIFMPVMNGADFIIEYKKRFYAIPIIALSAANRGTSQTLDVADFMEKPFDLYDLLYRIEALLK